MSRKYFGTDGIRGVANQKLTPELAFSLAQAVGRYLIRHKQEPFVAIGLDTRRSGPMLEAAMIAGLNSVGVSVQTLGIVPTPTVSYVARTFHFGMGVIISASHNPAPDNGIKLVGHDGGKLPESVELEIEALMESPLENRPVGEGVGSSKPDQIGIETYLNSLVALVPERLDGLRVAVDAAHGAAYKLAPEILIRLGAEVVVTGAEPDGININEEGGATKPETIQDFTLEHGCDIGVAFDGDADRAVFCDEKGRLINGDRTMGIWAVHWQKQGKLNPPVVVGTVMTNGGFEAFLESKGIALERAPVGDKYVAQRIQETGARVGGEQSGHIIFPEIGPTGDGLVTMLELLRVLRREDRPASEFYDDYIPWPQLLINVSVESKDSWNQGPRVQSALSQAESDLVGKGRINVRPSGTQPMVRVMVEADDISTRDQVAHAVVEALEGEAKGEIYSKVDLTYALGD